VAFQQYAQDALQRQQHDLDFPNEPPQLLPGENVSMQDGKPQVSGVTAVMGINNILMQDIVRENPGMSFGMEESFPMASTYPGGAPLGPIVQLNASSDGGNAITSEAADAAVNYWQNEAANLQGDVTSATSDTVMKSYSHDAVAAGNLLENNGYSDQAAQAYQTALEMYPSSNEAVKGLAQALSQQGLYDQVNATLDNFLANNPSQQAAVANYRKLYGGK
jgi:tetratricopeptide (TPR) repeat protein